MPLYKYNSSGNRASDALDKAAGTFSRMQTKGGSTSTTEGPGKTVGGAITSGAGMAMGGYMVGAGIGASTTAAATAAGAGIAEATAAGSSAGPWGAGIGALIGIGAYLFS